MCAQERTEAIGAILVGDNNFPDHQTGHECTRGDVWCPVSSCVWYRFVSCSVASVKIGPGSIMLVMVTQFPPVPSASVCVTMVYANAHGKPT